MNHPTARAIRDELEALADPAYAKVVARFFKTAPGDYAEGDVFIGLSMPKLRAFAKRQRDAPLAAIPALLSSPKHEIRLAALLILVYKCEAGSDAERAACFELYLAQLPRVNNWDLVDVSAPAVIGRWLADKDRALLFELANAKDLWRRRVAIISCLALVHAGDSGDALRLSALLLDDHHDLIHKAVGWVLRDIGKHIGQPVLTAFLEEHAPRVPATTMRYATEHYPVAQRKAWIARAKRPAKRPSNAPAKRQPQGRA